MILLPQCGNSRIFLSHRFYVKSILENLHSPLKSAKIHKNQHSEPLNVFKLADFALLQSTKLISRQIWVIENHEISTLWLRYSFYVTFWKTFHCVEKRKKLVHVNKIFREINSLIASLAWLWKTLLLRNVCQKRVNFHNFHTVAFSTLIVFIRFIWRSFFE